YGGCDRAIVEDNVIDHWLSLDTSSYVAVRRNVVSDTSGAVKLIGLELAGGINDVFTDNVVEDGMQTGISVSGGKPKDNVLWAHNTIRLASIWGAQIQGQAGGATHHYFYDDAFLLTRGDDAFGSAAGHHGFRMNGNCFALTVDASRMIANAGEGIQFSQTGFDQLTFIGNTIADNGGPSVSGDPGGTDLLWTANIVQRNGTDTQLTSRGFTGP